MRKWLLAAVAILVLGSCGAIGFIIPRLVPTPQPTPAAGTQTARRITAKGQVVPSSYARLSFRVGGQVAKLAVKAGDEVEKGQLLAALDSTDLDLQVRAAEDGVNLNRALLAQAERGTRAEEVAIAQAALDTAVARYDQLKSGSTAEQIRAAQAAYDAALAKQDQLQAGARTEQVQAAQAAHEAAAARLAQAQAGTREERLAVSRAALEKASVAVQEAQTEYDRLAWRNGFEASPQARRLQLASLDYVSAQAQYEELARGSDEAVLRAAEAEVASARARYEELARGSDESVLQAAAAEVAAAAVRLHDARRGPTAEDLTAAEANVRSARAQLDLKKAGPLPTDLDVVRARLRQAETALEQARAAAPNATIRAPFAGTVAEVLVREGELVGPLAAAIALADLRELVVETVDLDEASAVRVQNDQAVEVVVNAFKQKTLSGRVKSIAPRATLTSTGDPNYTVTIGLEKQDPELRWGMTAKVDFGEY